ncbi:SepM family pheromone-processing serine protease [Thermoflavimicrobium dichotomicum]|uniref:endopeptidase La n=1 Tax=Thermoflavimicrobium dichotomicum TaxID=46223 RepID=A0A1I3SV45_9BACL|nr:SepM family pheromone-processing serine protease [Thermoflavimicrobium dichotomicum]SFJ61247.1 PDZ domain-containing protein [Thermoflavimicrobium dichotomicum]
MKKTKQLAIFGFCLSFIIIGFTVFYFTPVSYFAMLPGEAMDTKSFVRVGTTGQDERGSFLLTTISLKRASIADYLLSFTSDEMKLVPEEQILAQNESDEEYERRQQENMIESQNHAIIAAFRQAKKPMKVEHIGVEVIEVTKNAKSGLKTGDLIQAIDKRPIRDSESLIRYLQNKKAGEMVEVSFVRKNKPMKQKVSLISLPSVSKEEKSRAGLGIVPMDRIRLHTNPPAQIKTENIGGPSAGLMFSLEVLDQLLPENLTRGYTVAGTGTINDKGEVGQIGGIEFKVLAAEREGAQIFFCPKDIHPGDDNEKIAKETARKIHTKMKIVPVSKLDDAVKYLRKLPELSSSVNEKTLTALGSLTYNNSVFKQGVESCKFSCTK